MAVVSTEEQILSYLSSRPATPEHLIGHLGISSEDWAPRSAPWWRRAG
jgi:hypothetical protein